jgi:hypothetical protein
MARALQLEEQNGRVSTRSAKGKVIQLRQEPNEVAIDYSDGTTDVTSCDAPRRRSLAFAILNMNVVGVVANLVLAVVGHTILAQQPGEFGQTLEGWGLELGRDTVMTGVNAQGIAWIVLTAVAMLINVGIVFHLIHDTALHYRFRAWACRLLARVITSLNIIGGDKVKGWSREILDRSRMDRIIGFALLMFVGIPLFVLGATLPWLAALFMLGNPQIATAVTAVCLLIVLVPTTIELFRIALHIRNADAAE